MKAITDYLAQHGRRSVDEIASIFGFASNEDAEHTLKNLVREGVLRCLYYLNSPKKYASDINFRCKKCKSKYPAAIRHGTSEYCRSCKCKGYVRKYSNKQRVILTNFLVPDVGPTWQGKMSQEWLCKKL